MLRIAAAIRAALLDDAGWCVDPVPGMTPEMIRNGWWDVSEGGF